MEHFYIIENDLRDDEVEYELNLRQIDGDSGSDGRRVLRNWLRSERNVEYDTERTISDEYQATTNNLRDLETDLLAGRSAGGRSRLIHYYRRIRRGRVTNLQEQENRKVMLDIIRRMGSQYFQLDFVSLDAALDAASVDNRMEGARKSLTQQFEGADEEQGAVGGTQDPDDIRAQCLAIAKQILERSLLPPERRLSGRSIDSQMVQPRSLREEMEAAERRTFSLEGTSRPFQIIPQGPQESSNQRQGLVSTSGAVREGPTPWTATLHTEPRLISSSGDPWSRAGGIPVPPPVSLLRNTVPVAYRSLSPPLSGATLQRPAQVATGFSPGLHPDNTRPNSSYAIPKEAERVSCPRNPPPTPTNVEWENASYVHVSEINDYIHTYVRQVLMQNLNRNVMRDTMVNHLASQVADMGIRDSEMARISREGHPMTSGGMGPRTTPTAALQQPFSGLGRDRITVNRESDVNPPATGFPDYRRNSFPQSFIPDQPNVRSPQSLAQGNQGMFNTRPSQSPGPTSGIGPNNVNLRSRLPHQTCNIMEKWPKFGGDTNPVPVVDFLRQLELLCRSYQISEDELRTHAHLLFKDDASIWYTAYEPKFDSWNTLLYYLRMRYDNPNRDRFVREEMRNRKQRPNELFSAFLTDMETLAQRLIRKMTEQEKFDIIAENMKISYKRRLALEEVVSIEHLAQLCYRFDTLEAHLYNPKLPLKPHGINEVKLEDSESCSADEYEEDGVLNALEARKFRSIRSRRVGGDEVADFTTRPKPLCWNCRKLGHLWRECEMRKAIFCHMCGHPEVTASNCPQQHNLRPLAEESSKND